MKILQCLTYLNTDTNQKEFISSFYKYLPNGDINFKLKPNQPINFKINENNYTFSLKTYENSVFSYLPSILIKNETGIIFNFPIILDALKNIDLFSSLYSDNNINDSFLYFGMFDVGVSYNKIEVLKFLSFLDFKKKDKFISAYLDEIDYGSNVIINNIITFDKINKELQNKNKKYIEALNDFDDLLHDDNFYLPYKINEDNYYIKTHSEGYDIFYVINDEIAYYSIDNKEIPIEFNIQKDEDLCYIINKLNTYKCLFKYKNGHFINGTNEVLHLLFRIEHIVNIVISSINEDCLISPITKVQELMSVIRYRSMIDWQTHSLWNIGTGWKWSQLGYLTEEKQYSEVLYKMEKRYKEINNIDFDRVLNFNKDVPILNIPENITNEWKDFVKTSFEHVKKQVIAQTSDFNITHEDLDIVERYLIKKEIINN